MHFRFRKCVPLCAKIRTTMAYVLTRRLGYRLANVAAYLNRDTATVTTLLARMNAKMVRDRKLQPKLAQLVRKVES